MDIPVQVPVDDPNADTEWNDILRKHGVIPEKVPSPTPIIQEAILEARRQEHENRLDSKTLDELDELEDEEDDAFLQQYRNQRLAELANISSSSIFNQVYPVQKPEYSREVTEASKEAYVLVHLSSSLGGNMESRLLTELWREMARKFGHVKFCEIQADMCIEGYPERNTPTILVYHNGDIKEQIVTLKALGGEQTRMTDLEAILIDVGAVKAKDQRVARSRSGDDQVDGKLRRGRMSAGDDDDDWD